MRKTPGLFNHGRKLLLERYDAYGPFNMGDGACRSQVMQRNMPHDRERCQELCRWEGQGLPITMRLRDGPTDKYMHIFLFDRQRVSGYAIRIHVRWLQIIVRYGTVVWADRTLPIKVGMRRLKTKMIGESVQSTPAPRPTDDSTYTPAHPSP